MRVIVRCVRGAEWLCADENSILVPEASDLAIDRREVTFVVPAVSPALLLTRTSDDVYIEVGRLTGTGTDKSVPDALAARLARLHWQTAIEGVKQLRPIAAMPLLDVVASLEGRCSYNRFAVESAAGKLLGKLTGGTYLERSPSGRAPGEPDITVRLFIRGGITVAAIRLPRTPLHRRDYKRDSGPGTLHPPVAAMMARLAHQGKTRSVRDPFRGDGTIAIETALANRTAAVHASDLDAERLRNARRNATRAGVQIEFSQRDAAALSAADGRVDAIVTNPPWGQTVAGQGMLAQSLKPFWQLLPDLLTGRGSMVAIADAEHELPASLRTYGLQAAVGARIRLAARVSDIVLATPAGRPEPAVRGSLARWLGKAIAAGIATRTGFLSHSRPQLTRPGRRMAMTVGKLVGGENSRSDRR